MATVIVGGLSGLGWGRVVFDASSYHCGPKMTMTQFRYTFTINLIFYMKTYNVDTNGILRQGLAR